MAEDAGLSYAIEVDNASVEDVVLPELRQDLTLLEGPSNSEGAPTWDIFDSIFRCVSIS